MWIAEKIYFQGNSGYTRAYQGSELVWEIPSKNYFYIEALENNSIVRLIDGEGSTPIYPVTLEYSLDKRNWYNWDYTVGTSLNQGDKLYLRGDNPHGYYNEGCGYTYYFDLSGGTFNLGGDIRSLVKSDMDIDTVPCDNCFQMLFNGQPIVSVSDELLSGFTTLSYACYGYMFYGCYGLTNAPALPANTLSGYCYYYMFCDCTSLTTAPELLAPTLVTGCYDEMFYGCKSLNYIKCLATDISASYCTHDWVFDVASSGTFVQADTMTGWTRGDNGIPYNWTIEGSIDFTKKYWWNSTSNINSLPTAWNNGYHVELDAYITSSLERVRAGYMFAQTNNSPIEVFFTYNFYFDQHYPNSTTAATVSTSDYDNRVSINRTNFNKIITPNTQYTFQFYNTPTQYIRILESGETKYTSTQSSVGDKTYCNTEDYAIIPATFHRISGLCYVSDVRMYDDQNQLIHDYRLYPYQDGYAYYDMCTKIWHSIGITLTNVVETNRPIG